MHEQLVAEIKDQYPLLFTVSNPRLGSTESPRVQDSERRAERMLVDGYFEERLALSHWSDELKEVERLVHELDSIGISPVMTFVTDFPWVVFRSLSDLFGEVLGSGFRLLPDFWVWRVDPRRGEAGWKLHRDKSGRMGLFPDGRPRALTCWIPINASTPMNGCMYVVPKQHDRNYGVDKTEGLGISGFGVVRALPADAGDVLIWDQTVMHWGAQSSEFADAPRVSMALEIQSADTPPFNQPLLDPQTLPDEALRLALIGKQMLQYRHMYPLSPTAEDFAKHLIQSFSG